MQHVNHANYLTYVEEARLNYYDAIFGLDDDWHFQNSLIMARCEIDYMAAIDYDDEILVDTKCARLGNTSFELAWKIIRHCNGREEVSARGKTVIVCYDYLSKKAIEIPRDKGNAIQLFEQKNGNLIQK
jgi:acyl-CoA thioester hydrolase